MLTFKGLEFSPNFWKVALQTKCQKPAEPTILRETTDRKIKERRTRGKNRCPRLKGRFIGKQVQGWQKKYSVLVSHDFMLAYLPVHQTNGDNYATIHHSEKMLCNLRCLKVRLRLLCNKLSSSLSLVSRQLKLCKVFIFGMAYYTVFLAYNMSPRLKTFKTNKFGENILTP